MIADSHRARIRVRGRRSTRPFVSIPHDVLEHQRFAALSPHACKLLLDMARQYRGSNNGDLTAIFTTLQRERHWRSRTTLYKALGELQKAGFLKRTRKGKRIGGAHYPSLYALTWWKVDPSDKHGERTDVAPNTWQRNPGPPHGLGSRLQVHGMDLE